MNSLVFENRNDEIDYDRLGGLCFIGRYERRLPVSIVRMMENAYDWEHLPHVHESSFKGINLVEDGKWGWRAVAILPDSRSQHLELLVDRAQSYWATTVLSGDAKGFEIHTQAKQVTANEIDVVINFYLPKAFSKVLLGLKILKWFLPFKLYEKVAEKLGINSVSASDSPERSILNALHYQYSVLYDEDEILMSGRQEAIDRQKKNNNIESPTRLSIGQVGTVLKQLPKVVQFGKHRYVVNQWKGEWVIYAADCPHMLGPIEESDIDSQGRVTCPWHGYQFDILSGKSCSDGGADLKGAPILSIIGDQLVAHTD